MLTVEAIKALGANTDEGIARCMGNEGFYLRMVNLALDDKGYDALKKAVDEGDIKAGFEAAHALKGVLANLALTPLLEPAGKASDLMKAGSMEGCAELTDRLLEEREKFRALL